MKDIKLNEYDHKRVKIIANEIQDYLNAIHSECNQENAFRPYLREKLRAIKTDVNVLNSIIEDDEEDNN